MKLRIRRASEYIKYDDTYNPVHQLFVDALDTPGFRKYILAKAAPVWNERFEKQVLILIAFAPVYCHNIRVIQGGAMNTPNWAHNSGKAKKAKGMCKAQLKARRQALRALKARIAK